MQRSTWRRRRRRPDGEPARHAPTSNRRGPTRARPRSRVGVGAGKTRGKSSFLVPSGGVSFSTAVGQCSPSRSPGQSERTRGRNSGSKGERGADRQHLTPAKRCAPDEERREQNAAQGAPPRNARKRQLIEAATALGQHEEPGECDPANEAECTNEEREREVRIDAEYPTRHDAHTEPCCCPREAH